MEVVPGYILILTRKTWISSIIWGEMALDAWNAQLLHSQFSIKYEGLLLMTHSDRVNELFR